MQPSEKCSGDNDAVREKILDAALEILFENGFANLSMRKIALRANMTAANLYNYYSNKDEIYMAIQSRGFSLIYQDFKAIQDQIEDPFIRMQQLVRAYLNFGLNSADQYDIMFSRNTPKYSDYLGTSIDSMVTAERKAALRVVKIAAQTIGEMREEPHCSPIEDPEYQAIRLWVALHGIVSLLNARVLDRVDPDIDSTIERLVCDLMDPFSPKRFT